MRNPLLRLLYALPFTFALPFLIGLLVCIVALARCDAQSEQRDLYPDTWVANDALGRAMPGYAQVGPVKRDHRRVVGIFYIAWHSDNLATLKNPYAADVSRVLAGDPNARLDAKNPLWTEGSYHWGEPEMGYFLSKDEYVIRRDMSMLADAGVDVLIMDVTNAVRYWDEALKGDPQFLYLNDWNEWTAGKYQPTGGTTQFMRRNSPYFFVDQYDAEFNRTIQPMHGGYTDNYYMQMAQNIRRYKGVRPIPVNRGLHTMKMQGGFGDWARIPVEYLDTVGDTVHRDYNGYGGLHYTDDTGRNDIVRSKVAVDRNMVYFYVVTHDNLTPHTGHNWMLLLIDADRNPQTGWYGYDFLINSRIMDAHTTTLMHYVGDSSGGHWAEVARLRYRYVGKELEIAVPRKLLALKGNSLSFDFKWADNPTDLKDPISLCTSGDTAPNRRFNYRFLWQQ